MQSHSWVMIPKAAMAMAKGASIASGSPRSVAQTNPTVLNPDNPTSWKRLTVMAIPTQTAAR